MKVQKMLHINGTLGEGGGQILRSSLALSLVTGKPFAITNIRGKRQRPGLMRQHHTAAVAAATVGCAELSGAVVGSQELEFIPGTVRGGEYEFSVGTAGSAMLVLQTILPALMVAEKPSVVRLEGGTHNPWAPPFEFVRDAFAPLLQRMGVKMELTLRRPGFYPAGGGRLEVRIEPAYSLGSLALMERGDFESIAVRAQVAHVPKSVATREARLLSQRLAIPSDNIAVETVADSIGPGNVVFVTIQSEDVTEVMTGFGQKGVSAQNVASKLAGEVRRYLGTDAAVGRHLADQLLIPMAMGQGGQFTTLKPSLHTETNIEVIRSFLDVDIQVEEKKKHVWCITVAPTKE